MCADRVCDGFVSKNVKDVFARIVKYLITQSVKYHIAQPPVPVKLCFAAKRVTCHLIKNPPHPKGCRGEGFAEI